MKPEKKVEVNNQEEVQNTEEKKKDKPLKAFGKAVIENPAILIPFISGIGSVLFGGMRMVSSKKQAQYQRCLVHDDVTELNYRTTHPLSNSEILELSSRKVDGETTGEALVNMGVLRNERVRKK